MTNLSDTQRILLSSAAQRDSGSLLPLPPSLKASGGTTKAVTALLKYGFAEERETNDAAAIRRQDGDITYGVFITPAGGAAIGIDLGDDNAGSGMTHAAPAPARARATATTSTSATPRPSTKAAAVVALLRREEGATLPDLIAATNWLPHTTRAALTGLRKKGHDITRGKRAGVTCYRIAEAG